MANEENIVEHQFKEGNTAGKGRPKGAKNRSTLLRKWLDARLKIKHPVSGKEVSVTLEDDVALSIITQARKGNVKAQALVLDSLYGKLTNTLEAQVETKVIVEYVDDGSK